MIKFSIIIPTRNRPKELARCITGFTKLDYPIDAWELIVVNDGDSNSLNEVTMEMEQSLPLSLVNINHGGPAAARNAGANLARGDFLAFMDDDCVPVPNWLQTLSVRFNETPDCAVGGRAVNALPNNLYSTASELLIDYLFVCHNANPDKASFLTSNNLALPANRFHALGGFNTRFLLPGGEDREFCDRWFYHGYRMIYAPEVVAYHAHDLKFRTFCQQHFNYGRGAFFFHQLRAYRNNKEIRPESRMFYINLLRYPFSLSYCRRPVLIAALLMVSQMANAAGYFAEKMNQNIKKG